LIKEKGYGEGFFPLLIQKKEEVDDSINKKKKRNVAFPTIDSKQTKTVLK
jgi:hypothetical protein